MNDLAKIRIFDIVGSGHCTASEDGQKIFQTIKKNVKEGKRIILSFENVEDLTSAFLNAAVGQLYSEFSEQQIKECLSVIDTKQEDLVLLKRVVERAKEFFKNPERYKNITKEMLGGGDDL